MEKWEYLLASFYLDETGWVVKAYLNDRKVFEGKGKDRRSKRSYQAELFSQLGQVGWELVATTPRDHPVIAYFKRPLT